MSFAVQTRCCPVLVPAPGSAMNGQLVPEGYIPGHNQALVSRGSENFIDSRGHAVRLNAYMVQAHTVITSTPVARQLLVSSPHPMHVLSPAAATQVDRTGHVVVGGANHAPAAASGGLRGRVVIDGGDPRIAPPRGGRPPQGY